MARVCLGPPKAAGGPGTPTAAVSNRLPAQSQLSLCQVYRVRTQVGGGMPSSSRHPVGRAGEAGGGPPTFVVAQLAGKVERAVPGDR